MSFAAQVQFSMGVLQEFLGREGGISEVDRPQIVAHATLSALAHHWPLLAESYGVPELLERTAVIRSVEPSRWMVQRRIAISRWSASVRDLPTEVMERESPPDA